MEQFIKVKAFEYKGVVGFEIDPSSINEALEFNDIPKNLMLKVKKEEADSLFKKLMSGESKLEDILKDISMFAVKISPENLIISREAMSILMTASKKESAENFKDIIMMTNIPVAAYSEHIDFNIGPVIIGSEFDFSKVTIVPNDPRDSFVEQVNLYTSFKNSLNINLN